MGFDTSNNTLYIGDSNGSSQLIGAPLPLSIANGGTGATTAAGVLTNLGVTATAAELNMVDGVTSNVQTQLDNKDQHYSVYITIEGDADTYYPVSIPMTTSKEYLGYISVWKNLGSTTPSSYSGNHDSGTSSLWLLYEGRSKAWDGNGGFVRTLYKNEDYATLVSHANPIGYSSNWLFVWLRGGGCSYWISTNYDFTPTIYYSAINLGSDKYPVYLEPRTDIGNGGIYNSTYLGYGDIIGNATSADYATTAGSATSATSATTATTATSATSATSASSCSGNAATATRLANTRYFQTNLASTTAYGFTGAANCTPGVTGVLPLSNGGTGVTSISSLKSALGIAEPTAHLTSGTLFKSDTSESLKITVNSNHKFLLICGVMYSNLVHVSTVIPISGISTSSSSPGIYLINDEAYYLSLYIYKSGTTIYISRKNGSDLTYNYITDVYSF